VVENAAESSPVNSRASRSQRVSPVRQPTISTMEAKIGTPSTKAPNIRWTWATIQITRRPFARKNVR